MRRRELLQTLAGAGLAAAGVGDALAMAAGARQPRRGGRIRVASMSSSSADTLDPARGALSTDYVRHYMLYSGLTQYDGALRAQPALAESIESGDRTTWNVRLRRGVHFHDGRPLTSADVVYSLWRHKLPETASKMKPVADQFSEIRATGTHELQIRLASPNADLPSILAASHFLIVPDGTRDFRSGNGTGPFRLQEFMPGIRTVTRRNPDYWKSGRPWLDEVELIGIPDESARVNALLAGDVHVVVAVNPRSMRRIEASGTHAVLETPSSLYTDLILRQDAAPTGNPDFVLALKHLFDRDLIRKALFRGVGRVGNDHPIPPGHRYYNTELPQRTFDLDRARYHLRRAGLGKVRLPVYASAAAEGSVDMASLLQENAAQVGLSLAVNRVPADGYWSSHYMKHPLTFGNTNPRATADLVFSLLYKSDAMWNESGWRNARFDELLVLARGEADEGRRKQMYGEMQQLVHDHCGVCIPLFMSLLDGYDRRVRGYGSIPIGGLMGYSLAEYVWLDD